MATAAIVNPMHRPIIYRTRGSRHGPITRLMSPGDVGELVKPFIFLDLVEMDKWPGHSFAPHPHSGIATVTLFLEGNSTYADSTGRSGMMREGAVEWMRAGGGVWHTGGPVTVGRARGYQLWLALPPQLELAPPESVYVDPDEVETVGNVRVILGSYCGRKSAIALPTALTFLHVRLQDGDRWCYRPATTHSIAWLALNSGQLRVGDTMLEREIAVFAEGNEPIEIVAKGAVELIIGSAEKHPYPLVSGYYSVHTNAAALAEGESNIAALEHSPAVAALRGA